MRCRGLAHRLVITLAAAWFGLLTVTPATLRPCPMHSALHSAAAVGQAALHGMAPVSASASPSADAHPGMSHAGMSHAGMWHDGISHDGEPETTDAPQPCDCLGDCCCLPAHDRFVRAPRVRSDFLAFRDVIAPTSALRRPVAHPRLLPFAIGPPRHVIA